MAFVPYSGMPQGWMRQIIDASPSRPVVRPVLGCIGNFWDNEKKCLVSVNMGFVVVRALSVFRAASSCLEKTASDVGEVLEKTAFEGVEVAAQNADNLQNERSAENVRVVCNTRTSANPLAESC